MVIYNFDITLCQVAIIMIVHPDDIVKKLIIINPNFKTNINNLRCLFSIHGNFSVEIRDNIINI
jgi:hypothetical protein